MAPSTRDRLLGAAIDSLLDTQGAGLTTGRLAARAGVVQSAFYNHFSSVEECRAAAMSAIREQITSTASSFFADLGGPRFTTAADVEKMLLTVFERAHLEPSIYGLLVAHSHTPPIRDLIDDVLTAVRDELAAKLLENAPDNSPMTQEEAALAARLTLAVIVDGLGHVLDGADAALVADAMSRFIVSGVYIFHGINPSDLDPEVD